MVFPYNVPCIKIRREIEMKVTGKNIVNGFALAAGSFCLYCFGWLGVNIYKAATIEDQYEIKNSVTAKILEKNDVKIGFETYRVITTDKGKFFNEDDSRIDKFNAASIDAALAVGTTHTISTVGKEMSLFGNPLYPNIEAISVPVTASR